MSEPVLYEVAAGIARITLNRPERLNAFDAQMATSWAEVTHEVVSRDDVDVILLTGSGRAFCAGGDVSEMASGGYDGDSLTKLAKLINAGQMDLLGSAVPVIAAAHGTTAGGGLGILLTSDYAIVGENSKIGSVYAKLGLTPDLTVTSLLPRAIGERRALQLVLQDRLLSAQEACDWGIVAEVVADEDVLTRAEELAAFITGNAARARGEAKRLVRAGYGRSLGKSLADEARTIGYALETEEAQARLRAFTAK